MSKKKIHIMRKPKHTEDAIVEQFVAGGAVDSTEDPRKKLTVIIPKDLHRKVKQRASQEDRTIADLVTDILEQHL